MTNWLIIIATVLAADTLLAAVRWNERSAAAGTRAAHALIRLAQRARRKRTPAGQGDDEPAAETMRCGYRISRTGLHGDDLVRIRDTEVTFYVPAELYEGLDDYALIALGEVQHKAAALGGVATPTAGVPQVKDGDMDGMWEAYRQVQRERVPGGPVDGMAFGFESDDAPEAEG